MGSHCGGFSGCGLCALEHTGCSSCSTACGVSPDQGWNPCLLHRKVGSQTGDHQGSLESQCVTNWGSGSSARVQGEGCQANDQLSSREWCSIHVMR